MKETKTKITAEVVADSLSLQGDRLTSLLITFPRIILAEVNTHRMLSKNTSSSRAIPFEKMVEAIENDPFIPIAWQKEHKGMQGTEYIIDPIEVKNCIESWLIGRDDILDCAKVLHGDIAIFDDTPDPYKCLEMGVTKQICNRLLEPFMWTTMLITGSKEGWDNFFKLRCPQYEYYDMLTGKQTFYRSKKDWLKYYENKPLPKAKHISKIPETSVEWLQINKGQAEIHMMALAESIYDALNESKPKQLEAGEWHIPFYDKIPNKFNEEDNTNLRRIAKVKISTAMAARTSYTVVGDEKVVDYEKMIALHDRLLAQDPPHSSPFEHCARAMSDEEYYTFVKGNTPFIKQLETNPYLVGYIGSDKIYGWCRNFKGFIPYRHIVESKYEQ